MRAGLLRERVDILEEVYVGTAQTTRAEWRALYNGVRARVVHDSRGGSKAVEGDEVVTDYRVEFHLRHYFAEILTTRMRIGWRGEKYEIVHLAPYRDRQELIVMCKVVINDE